MCVFVGVVKHLTITFFNSLFFFQIKIEIKFCKTFCNATMITFKFIHIVILLVINFFTGNINYVNAKTKIREIKTEIKWKYFANQTDQIKGITASSVTIFPTTVSILMDIEDMKNDVTTFNVEFYSLNSRSFTNKVNNRTMMNITTGEKATFKLSTNYTVPKKDVFTYKNDNSLYLYTLLLI